MVNRTLKSLIIVSILFLSNSVNASHILGGEVTYRYLDNNGVSGTPFRYEITIRVYNNRDGNVFEGIESNFGYSIYDAGTGAHIEYRNPPNDTVHLNPNIPVGCNIAGISNFRITLNQFVDTVSLPLSFNGYRVIWERGTRLNGIDNIVNSGNAGNTFHAFIPASIYNNSSPQFNDKPIPAICAGDTTAFINNAFDPDGDQLVYKFTTGYDMHNWNSSPFSPYNAPEDPDIYNNYNYPPPLLNYQVSYSALQPFGTAGYSFINSSTGLAEYYTPITGNFVVNVEIEEYRNIGGTSTLLSSTRRELQFFSGSCPLNNTPVITTVEIGSSTIVNIEEGDSVHLTIQTTDVDLDSINLEVTGAILDSNSTYVGPLAAFVLDSATGIGTFDWLTECDMAGSYQFVVAASDDGCPPKKDLIVYTINISPFQATSISGADSSCFLNDSSTYSTIKSVGSTYQWTINNGSITGYNTDSTEATVIWGAPGNSRIEMVETSDKGCTDTTFKIVTVNNPDIITAETDTTICYGDTINLSAMGSNGYLWSPSQFLNDSTLSNPSANPDSTTEYIVKSSSNVCFKPDTVTIGVNYFGSEIPSDTVCAKDSLVIGEPSIANYTYAWSPSFGLNDTTIAQPTLWLDTDGVFTYTIGIVDSNSCIGTDTLTVLINPTPDSVEIFGGASLCPDIIGIDYYTNDTTLVGFNWLINGGVITSGQSTDSILVTWGAANNTAFIEVIPTDNNGCIGDTAKLDVLINQILQTQTPIGPDTLCFFDLANNNYSITNINGSTYTWNVIGGNINSGQGTNATNLTWNGSSTAYVFIEEAVNTSSSVCLGQSDTLRIKINASPDTTLPINGDSSLCSFTQNADYWINGMDSSTYTWVLNTGGTLISGQGTDSIQVNWDSTGTYPITVIETTNEGCIGRVIYDTVNIRSLPQTIAFAGTYMICPQNTQNISYTVNGITNSTYTWIFGGDTLSSSTNTSLVNFDTSNFIHTIDILETTEFGCTSGLLTLNIDYDPSDINMTYVTDNFDNEKLVELHWSKKYIDSLSNNINLYRRQFLPSKSAWQYITTISKFDNNYIDSPSNTALSSYQYYMTTENRCFDIDTTFFHHNILLEALADEPNAMTTVSWNKYADWSQFEGVKEYNIYRNLDEGGYELYKTTSSLDSLIEFTNAGDGFNHCYRIEAIQTDNDGISSWSNEVCINYNHIVHVYNALTPNGDGKNDFFYAENIWLYPDNQLEIYNRWGNLVHSASSYNNDWDGENLPDGTYFYVLKVEGTELPFKGDVLIQR